MTNEDDALEKEIDERVELFFSFWSEIEPLPPKYRDKIGGEFLRRSIKFLGGWERAEQELMSESRDEFLKQTKADIYLWATDFSGTHFGDEWLPPNRTRLLDHLRWAKNQVEIENLKLKQKEQLINGASHLT